MANCKKCKKPLSEAVCESLVSIDQCQECFGSTDGYYEHNRVNTDESIRKETSAALAYPYPVTYFAG